MENVNENITGTDFITSYKMWDNLDMGGEEIKQDRMQTLILGVIANGEISLDELASKLPGVDKCELFYVLLQMQAQNQLIMIQAFPMQYSGITVQKI